MCAHANMSALQFQKCLFEDSLFHMSMIHLIQGDYFSFQFLVRNCNRIHDEMMQDSF
jgi:hypothetical protein